MESDSLIPHTNAPLRIVVFDLDETLGYFAEFGMFWNAVETFYGRKLTQQEFNHTLDLYPEFIRPDIITILQFLKRKKEQKKCSHLMIYTNNSGPKEWAVFIKTYFESKLDAVIFDRIIAAFKVNGEQIELCRTTHNKTHGDFIKCTKLPTNSQICFLDDIYHPEMDNDNVYYINVKPYVYDLDYHTLIDRYVASNPDRYVASNPDITGNRFRTHVLSHLKRYNHEVVAKNPKEHEIERILTKHILQHIRAFFNQSKPPRRETKRNNDK
jgi:hypothetical protein